LDFKFPELSTQKKVTWICHVDETTDENSAMYDMIIGMDLMTSIGIYVDTEAKLIRWENNTSPLVTRGTLDNKSTLNFLYAMATDTVLQKAERRHADILDADYSAVDIDEHVDTLSMLSWEERQLLKETLKRHTTVFQGGLGVLDIEPIRLEMREGITPHHARAFPVPKAYEAKVKKEIDRLESLGVLEKNADSEWAAPTFCQPKKTGDIRILTDFRKLNLGIRRKPFPKRSCTGWLVQSYALSK